MHQCGKIFRIYLIAEGVALNLRTHPLLVERTNLSKRQILILNLTISNRRMWILDNYFNSIQDPVKPEICVLLDLKNFIIYYRVNFTTSFFSKDKKCPGTIWIRYKLARTLNKTDPDS
jgi:hypothetical protein